MKLFILAVVAFVLAVANAKPKDAILSPENPSFASESLLRKCPDCVNEKCPHGTQYAEHVAFPGDCSKFCRCEEGGALEGECPGGLHFNTEIQVCDWPDHAQCDLPGSYLGGCEHLIPRF